VFEAEAVEAALVMDVEVECVKIEVYEVDEEAALSLLEAVESEYAVLLAEALTKVFEDVIIEVEGVGTAMLVAAELVGDEIMLEGAPREGVEDIEGTALLEDSAAEDEDEVELDSVVTGSGTSTVTVGELTSIIEYPVEVTVAGLGVTVTKTV
jgi:hypothetical protein